MTREKQIEYFKKIYLTSSKNLVFMMPLHPVEIIAVKTVDC